MKTVTKRQFIIYGIFLVALVLLCSSIWYNTYQYVATSEEKRIDDPLDVVFDFYNGWLLDARNNNLTPEAGSLTTGVLSPEATTKLKDQLSKQPEIDPATCQQEIPVGMRVRVVHELPTEMEVMAMAKYASTSLSTPVGYALVKLSLTDRVWHITDISCISDDSDTREFTFMQKGQLLKNVPEPYDNTRWHLIFSENGTPGHVAVLGFTASSTCIHNDARGACNQNDLKEAAYAEVTGNLTEAEVTVHELRWSENQF